MHNVQYEALRSFVFEVLGSIGVPEEDAEIVAEHLATNNLVGHDSHGIQVGADPRPPCNIPPPLCTPPRPPLTETAPDTTTPSRR